MHKLQNGKRSSTSYTKTKLDKLLYEYRRAKSQVKEETIALEQAEQYLQDTIAAQKITQEIARQVQQSAHNQIASVVSRCLESVYDDPYQFEITFEKRRGKTEAVLKFVQDGMKLDPLEESSGGAVNVAAFALRLVSLLLARPYGRKVLILDEPFGNLDVTVRPRVKAMLEMLARELEVQIIMVTHDQAMEAGTVVRLED